MSVVVRSEEIIAARKPDQYGWTPMMDLLVRVPNDPATVESVLAALEHANNDETVQGPWREPDGEPTVGAIFDALAPSGVVLVTWEAIPEAGLLAWLASIAEYLSRAGVDGEILPFQSVTMTSPSLFARNLTAILFLSGSGLENSAVRWRAAAPWRPDLDLASRWARWAVEWVTGVPGVELLMKQHFTTARAEPDEAVDLVARRIAADRVAARVMAIGESAARSVRFDLAGRLVAEIHADDLSWPAALAELRRMLVMTAGDCDLALARLNAVPNKVDPIDGLGGRRLPAPRGQLDLSTYYREHRYLDPEFVPDAYGMQVVTTRHLAKAHDLSGWTLTDLGGDRFLLEHPEPEKWFAPGMPDEATQESARADFGGMLLTTPIPPRPYPPIVR